jgi:methyl acetate hydrolase
MNRPLVALAAVAWLLQPPVTSAPNALDAFLRARVAAGDVPAVVAMVVDGRSTRYTGAFGSASVASKTPVTVDSIFRIASMTKPVTSVAAMMLYERGLLGLDDPVTKYLPEFSRLRVVTTWHDADSGYESRSPSRMITVRDLLTHTSGIAYSFVDPHLTELDDGHKDVVDLPLLHDPGKRFTYGPNTAVLGRIVAQISGEPLDAFLKTHIFDPLGMADTFFRVPAAKRSRVVTYHTRTDDGVLHETENPAALESPIRGDGGLFSTAPDFARFMQLFLNRGRAGTAQLLTEKTVEIMSSNQLGPITITEQQSTSLAIARPFPFGGGKDGFGLGFQIETRPAANGLRSAGSLSWGGIMNTHFWIDPQRSLAAVVLMQVLPYYDPRALAVLRGFEREVYKVEP